MILINLNCWHTFFLFHKLIYFIEVWLALMTLLEPKASPVNIVDITVFAAMFLEFFYILLRPVEVFLQFIFSVWRHIVEWHTLKLSDKCFYKCYLLYFQGVKILLTFLFKN
jgi:hypothetical protein